MEIKEKKKVAKEIRDKYKEIKFYLPHPFKIEAAEIKKLAKLDKDKCLICQQTYKINSEVLYMPCLHLYHKVCIIRWLIHNDKCPTCKVGYKPEDKETDKKKSNSDEEIDDFENEDNLYNITDEENEILKIIGINNLEEYLFGENDLDSDED